MPGRLEEFRKELDPHILRLVIKSNALPFLRTTWSCGGHIGRNGLYQLGG